MKCTHYVPIKIKRELYEKANNRCEECDSKINLQIHHIKAKQKGMDNSLKNLKLLCKNCHKKKGISNRMAGDRKVITYNLLIEDKNEEDWDYFVENKEEDNIEEALFNLIRAYNLKLKKRWEK